jgi:hypothetical protein
MGGNTGALDSHMERGRGAGIAVAQRMNMGGLFDAAGAQGQTEAASERGAAHRRGRGGSAQAAVAFGRKEPARMAVGAPELAQQFESALGQGHVAVPVAFSRPDVQEHAFGINVADLQLEPLAQASRTLVQRGSTQPPRACGNIAGNASTKGAARAALGYRFYISPRRVLR